MLLFFSSQAQSMLHLLLGVCRRFNSFTIFLSFAADPWEEDNTFLWKQHQSLTFFHLAASKKVKGVLAQSLFLSSFFFSGPKPFNEIYKIMNSKYFLLGVYCRLQPWLFLAIPIHFLLLFLLLRIGIVCQGSPIFRGLIRNLIISIFLSFFFLSFILLRARAWKKEMEKKGTTLNPEHEKINEKRLKAW